MNLLPWIEDEIAVIKKKNISVEEKLDLIFKKIPGVCRFKVSRLSDETKQSFIKTFGLKPSLLEIKNRKLNRRKENG